MNKHRKLSNIKLTQRYHLQHMGLWVLISLALLALLNALLYIVIVQTWGFSGSAAYEFPAEAAIFRRNVVFFLGVEYLLFAIALIMLAKATSHRIAGAFIGLQRTCERIAAGDVNARQKFRTYDDLDDLERAFNAMLDTLTAAKK